MADMTHSPRNKHGIPILPPIQPTKPKRNKHGHLIVETQPVRSPAGFEKRLINVPRYVRNPAISEAAKQLAHRRVSKRKRDGGIIRLDYCQRCGKDTVDTIGHHYDYKYPCRVYWLCRECDDWVHGREQGTNNARGT
jgi:hypothetical protein